MVLHWPKSLSDRWFVLFLSLAMMMSSSPAVNSSPSHTLCPLHSHGMHPNCGSAYRVGLRCMHPPRHCDCTCCYSTCGPECGGEDSHPRVCQRPVTCGTGMVSKGPQEALRGGRARSQEVEESTARSTDYEEREEERSSERHNVQGSWVAGGSGLCLACTLEYAGERRFCVGPRTPASW